MADTHDLSGKICLVTGASSGIGKATAAGLAAGGATVVLHTRTAEQGRAARDEISAKSGSRSIDLLTGDLASQAAVRRLADEFKAKYPRLHILVNNAGLNLAERRLTEDGMETDLAVNYLAPFLLTHLLLDALKTGAPARIVNLGTWVQPAVNLDDLTRAQRFDAAAAYSESKTALTMFTYALAQRLQGTDVTVNIVNPGLIRTNLGRDARGGFRLFLRLAWPLMKSAERAAEDVLYLATSPELEGVSGRFFTGQKVSETSPESRDAATAERLWQLSEQMTRLAAPSAG
jgi:NAD(P)-dependent dehydrogenase (short-subunit alcohol dehydrogenase family)